MDPPCSIWYTLYRIQTGHGCCRALLYKWKFQDILACDCGNGKQTINHIVTECQLRKFSGGFEGLHAVTLEAINWIIDLDINRYKIISLNIIKYLLSPSILRVNI